MILSVRTDRLSCPRYLARHWLHYGLLVTFALAAWSPQVLGTLGMVTLRLGDFFSFVIVTKQPSLLASITSLLL